MISTLPNTLLVCAALSYSRSYPTYIDNQWYLMFLHFLFSFFKEKRQKLSGPQIYTASLTQNEKEIMQNMNEVWRKFSPLNLSKL